MCSRRDDCIYPRRHEGYETAAFFVRLTRTRRVLKATLMCSWCGGYGCYRCDHDGHMRIEPLHPADRWTLDALAKVGTTYGAGSPP